MTALSISVERSRRRSGSYDRDKHRHRRCRTTSIKSFSYANCAVARLSRRSKQAALTSSRRTSCLHSRCRASSQTRSNTCSTMIGIPNGRLPLMKALTLCAETVVNDNVNLSCLIDKGLNASPDRLNYHMDVVLVCDERRGHPDCRIGVRQAVRANACARHRLYQCTMFQNRQAQISRKRRGRLG